VEVVQRQRSRSRCADRSVQWLRRQAYRDDSVSASLWRPRRRGGLASAVDAMARL